MLDLEASAGRLAQWRLRLDQFDLGIVHQPEKYHKAADPMFRLPQKTTNKTKGITNVDDDILTYCIVGQISESNTVSKASELEVGPLPTTNELMKVQTSDVLFRNLKKALRKDGTITINEDVQLLRKAPKNGALQIIVSERYKRTLIYHGRCPTMAGSIGTRKV